MKAYIDKSALVAELNRLIAELVEEGEDTMFEQGRISAFEDVKVFINHTLEVKEEVLDRNDKTKLMRKCVKTAYKRGYDMGVLQTTNKINSNIKEVDLEKEIRDAAEQYDINNNGNIYWEDIVGFAKHFFELGLKAQKGG